MYYTYRCIYIYMRERCIIYIYTLYMGCVYISIYIYVCIYMYIDIHGIWGMGYVANS